MSSPPVPAHHVVALAKEMFSRPLNGEIFVQVITIQRASSLRVPCLKDFSSLTPVAMIPMQLQVLRGAYGVLKKSNR